MISLTVGAGMLSGKLYLCSYNQLENKRLLPEEQKGHRKKSRRGKGSILN